MGASSKVMGFTGDLGGLRGAASGDVVAGRDGGCVGSLVGVGVDLEEPLWEGVFRVGSREGEGIDVTDAERPADERAATALDLFVAADFARADGAALLSMCPFGFSLLLILVEMLCDDDEVDADSALCAGAICREPP